MSDIIEYGAKLEQLGKLLQNQDATVSEISLLAYELGLTLQFRVCPTPEVESE